MKSGIFIVVLAAMGLAIVATPDTHAKAWWGWGSHGMNMRLAGSSFVVSTVEDGTPKQLPPFTSVQNGIAKGKSGRAQFRAQTVAGIPEFDPENCPEGLPLRGPLTATFVLTYNDGSILSGVTGGDNHYCTDGLGLNFADFGGSITGGDRRFEGATGFWEAAAEVDGARITGEIEIDLD